MRVDASVVVEKLEPRKFYVEIHKNVSQDFFIDIL